MEPHRDYGCLYRCADVWRAEYAPLRMCACVVSADARLGRGVVTENSLDSGDECLYGTRIRECGFLVDALVSFSSFLVQNAEGC